MKKKNCIRILRPLMVALLALSILVGVIAMPRAQASGYQASSIEKLDGSLSVDYTQYLDSSKTFRLPNTVSDDQEISVIITLDVTTLLDAYDETDKSVSFAEFALESQKASEIKAQISEKKANILASLEDSRIACSTGEDYSVLLSGFEIRIQAGDFDAVCKSLGKGTGVIVSEVYKPAETQLVENTVNVYGTGIFDSSASPYDGSGMVVAVLDTGLDSNHTAFSTDNFTSDHLGLTYAQVAAVLSDTKAYEQSGGLSVDDVYINEKVPFGYDYADNDPDVYSTHNNHGTHVSGVIAGKDDVITGVAPNAQIVSMKIFSDVMDSAISSWILAALEDCVILGVDVINMSLGTACGFSRESDEEAMNGVYDRIREAGISVVAAASNSYSSAYGSDANGNLGLTSNPDTATVGSPSTYEGVMSVASISGVETPYIKYKDTIIYFDEANDNAANQKDFFAALLGDKDSMEIEFVLVPGVGRTADYTGLDVTGKIALVRRGSNTFEEKAIIAEAQGAAGIIIYNNVSGDIKMNVGDATLAVCSISQDDGELLAAAGTGKLTISKSQTSGPFISDFSSWGPTPSLGIKPEITAHGGEILSSVTGGGYDRMSGTSMACPNLAGVTVLLRQYVVENFPEIANDNVQVAAMVNKLMMSTADIALNTNGLPYAVRKQGAGLANLMSAIGTTAYITTYDANGKAMDKTKLELGDDPRKTGVYTLNFTVTNFGSNALTYDIGAYVMTEGVSDTKTNAGETTVTEEAYILSGAAVEVSSSNGTLKGTALTVEAGKQADVTVTITLSDSDKKYLDDSFANGMYVEGYVTLTAKQGTEIDLSVPYLAFYGDWTKAPLFDLDYFETNADELDDSIAMEDKTLADAYASRPVGGVMEDYVSYLGSYYFLQDPDDMIISANRDYIALSNQEGTIHSLRFVWAGMLRNARKIEITITDDTTGEVVYRCVDEDVRKSYGDGGSIYPANVEIEFDTMNYNLANNSQYTVTLVGYLDYGDGGLDTNEKNVFQFPLTVDFEAPTVTGVEYYYEYDKTLQKNRLYAKVAIYDNHFAMAGQLAYVGMGKDESDNDTPELKAFEQYMTPIYSQRNSTTYVTFELTDYLFEIKENSINPNTFVITCYDYALNYASYEIALPDDFVDFYFDSIPDELTLSPNEVYTLEPLVYPNTEWAELLEYTSSRPGVVRVVNNKLVAVSSGSAYIKARDPQTNKSVTFKVTVLKEGEEGYRRYDKPVADVFRLTGYQTTKAFYILTNSEKELGDTGDVRFFEGDYSLSMYPSESVYLNYDLDAYFPNDTTVEFESSNENIVKVDAYGNVTAVSEGFASVTIKVLQDGRSTYYSESVSVEVKDPYVTSGATLSHYYGNGGLVMIPEDLSLTEIGSFAFSNYDYVPKTEEELAFDDSENTKQWYIGESTITKIVFPEGIEKIGAYACANLTALEEIVLPSTLESIEYGAFYGCSSLQKITFSGENNLIIINRNAFESCDLQGTLELPNACVISGYAFAGNTDLEGIVLSDRLLSIGDYAFAGCKGLTNVEIGAEKVKYGPYAFTGCESLKSFYVNSSVLPEGMFYECKTMEQVTIGPDVNEIGEFAFRSTAINAFEISSGNQAFMVQTKDTILSADGTILIAVSPTLRGEFSEANLGADRAGKVTAIGSGAFSHNTKLTSVKLPGVTSVGDYGFGSSESLTSVTLGKLTSIGEYAFFETSITQLPQFTADTQIGKYAFSFSDITSVTIPDGMEIAEGVFSECLSLEEVTIGNNVTLGKYAFGMDKDNIFEIKSRQQDGQRLFCYEFATALKTLTIGDNAVIGENAFVNAASLEKISLGKNARIGYMAFYNNSSLKDIDLSRAASIGDYAFSGDVYFMCMDDSMSIAAVSLDGYYLYTYHAPALERVVLSNAESIGEHAFSYCRKLTDVELNDSITVIPQYAFAGCVALENIDLKNIVTVDDYAFMECESLVSADLSGTETVGNYAFVYGDGLERVTLSAEGTDLGEGAFSYCTALKQVDNLASCVHIDGYAFAYTAITSADLSGAVNIGDHVFLKETLTPFAVILGEKLESLGDNPFALCDLAPFCKVEITSFNGVNYESKLYTYEISPTVSVIDGSLYCKTVNGLELITYAGTNGADYKVADGTVRVTAMAFAGSDVQMVTLPYTVASVGHKAFYGCEELHTVVFGSYNAPILEEEFDSIYYESLAHIPGTGDYGSYTDYDGTEVNVVGMGLIPCYMWNATDGLYSNVFYGANFVDYVGYVENKLTMVRPANGQHYDSYIFGQYFDLTIDGSAAADDVTLAAIAAIKAIPERVSYEDRAIVEAARAAYSRIATTEQQALVRNYADLISAEQRIIALTPTDEPSDNVDPEPEDSNAGLIVLIVIVILCVGGGAAWLGLRSKKKAATEPVAPEEVSADGSEEIPESQPETTETEE
ncbi:MAG: leucine-rich repeat protein [Faecousia sp.]